VTLQNVTITGGQAVNGGGLLNLGSGSLTITNSTISANHATADAAGVLVNGTATITNSTISGNTTPAFGGGVDSTTSVTLINSTISGNTAGHGGGVDTSVNGSVTLVYATVVQNTAATGANLATNNLTSFGSVVALPQGGGANCFSGGILTTSNGFNFSDDANATTSCKFNPATDRIGSTNNPMLGALANNGGPTQTRLPQSGSPLIDAIPLASCQADGASSISTDQRGLARPSGLGCDIGAVEVQVAAPAPLVITPKFTG
jgi:hypothetical protein